MEVILANFLRQHKSHDAWRYFIKKKRNATPNDPIKPPKDKVDKPNEYFLSELLQISISFQETKVGTATEGPTLKAQRSPQNSAGRRRCPRVLEAGHDGNL
jgi:hypothetical protein